MDVEQEILETGIKVVDLLAPYVKGGKIGEGWGGEVTCVPRPHGRRKRRVIQCCPGTRLKERCARVCVFC